MINAEAIDEDTPLLDDLSTVLEDGQNAEVDGAVLLHLLEGSSVNSNILVFLERRDTRLAIGSRSKVNGEMNIRFLSRQT